MLEKLIKIFYVICIRGNNPLSQGRLSNVFEVFMNGDYCTREGAERLKQQIEDYWAERGRKVNVNLIKGGFLASMRSARTDVRSNMINGVPTVSNENFA